MKAHIKSLNIDTGFDNIEDPALDELVAKYHEDHPGSGRAYTSGHLRSKYGMRIPRNRIMKSMKRVDHLGQGIKQHIGAKKKRQPYSVPRPNALWHMDGHHKLILWGIVIHGIADGYSRTVRSNIFPYNSVTF